MRLKGIAFENWTRYRGFHEVDLEALCYGVSARLEDDEERSNWLGKTSFLHAVPFGIFGRKPPSARLEDDWITKGEKRGGVLLFFDGPDGFTIKRTRKLGSSTQLEVTWFGEDDENHKANGDAAQVVIEERIGLSEADFFASCFFEQKQMARFVRALPSERMRVVADWLDLDPLQRCEKNTAVRLGKLLERKRERRARRELLESMTAEAVSKHLSDPTDAEPVKKLGEKLLVAKRIADDLHEAAGKVQAEIDEHADYVVEKKSADEYEGLKAEGLPIRDRLKDLNPKQLEADVTAASDELVEARAKKTNADEELVKALALKRGEFDGICPVTNDDCPVATEVSAKAAQGADRVTNARVGVSTAYEAVDAVQKRLGPAEAGLREARDANARWKQIVDRATVLKPLWEACKQKGEPPDLAELRGRLDEAWGASNAAASDHQALKSVLGDAKRWAKEVAGIDGELEKLDAQIATHREAVVIFGRQGAQRRASEDALSEIEHDTNAGLAESGIALRVGVRWAREAARGLATTCEICGSPFPTSQRAKECDSCGAKRGPKTVDKLDLDLSDTSGAAEDLAGITFQLAAAAWLRRARGTDFSAAFIDEPFSSLDFSHRQALSTHLATLLKGRYGFEQSFLVAHQQDVMDALPGRIDIVATKEGSRFA